MHRQRGGRCARPSPTSRLPLTPSKVMELIGIDDPPPSGRRCARRRRDSARAGRARRWRAQGRGPAARAAAKRCSRVLLDPAALAKVIPGCHALEQTGANRYRADVTVGVGMIKARYAAEIALCATSTRRSSLRLAGSGLSAGRRPRAPAW